MDSLPPVPASFRLRHPETRTAAHGRTRGICPYGVARHFCAEILGPGEHMLQRREPTAEKTPQQVVAEPTNAR